MLIAIDDEDETPPPGAGLTTVIPSDPAVERSADVSATVMAVALTSVAGREAPFTRTPVPATKPVPTMWTTVAADPAFNALGERDVTVGAGFVTTKGIVPEAPPPG